MARAKKTGAHKHGANSQNGQANHSGPTGRAIGLHPTHIHKSSSRLKASVERLGGVYSAEIRVSTNPRSVVTPGRQGASVDSLGRGCAAMGQLDSRETAT